MPNKIQIKRSNVSASPASLEEGELAYSSKAGSKTLFIGTNGGSNIEAIGSVAAVDHASVAHAPSNAQKNSDITKSEIETKLTGQIGTHSHAATSSFQNNLTATVIPTATDDSSKGYSVGSFWIVPTMEETYRCVKDTVGSAVWILTTLSTDELALVAVSGSADDLIDGSLNVAMTVIERNKLAGIAAGADTNNISDADAALLTGGGTNDLHQHDNMPIDGGNF